MTGKHKFLRTIHDAETNVSGVLIGGGPQYAVVRDATGAMRRIPWEKARSGKPRRRCRLCPSCCEVKPQQAFDGARRKCRSCRRAYQREYRRLVRPSITR